MVLVLLATRAYYSDFGRTGRVLSWAVVVGSAACLASLALMLLRLYVRPAFEDGKQKIAAGRPRRRGNP